MWEFPNLVVDDYPTDLSGILKEHFGMDSSEVTYLGEASHIFSHVEWRMKTYSVNALEKNEQFRWVTDEELSDSYALPTAFKKLLSIQEPEK